MTRLSFKHCLHALKTPFGWRELYDSAAYCNRCGACTQVCPAYHLNPQETFSPRGRNQLLRLICEGKIKLSRKQPLARDLLISCTLCGRCSQACASHTPTAEHVLEMRRRLGLCVLPRLLQRLLLWRETAPRLFAVGIRLGLWGRRCGLVTLLRKSGVTLLPGLTWINRADELLPRRIGRWRITSNATDIAKPPLIYLPSLEAEFFLPELASQTLAYAQREHAVTVWRNTASGLFSYVYGQLRQSRRTLRRLINRHAQTADGNAPLLTDSVDTYVFLKRAAQVFSGNMRWQKRAQKMADCVCFVTEVMPKSPTENKPQGGPVRLEPSALFDRQSRPFTQALDILTTFFGKNLLQCLYTEADIPAFGYAFTAENRAEQMGLEVVRQVAQTHTRTVYTLSGLAALELTYFLQRFYPAAKAKHLVHINR